MVSKGGFKSKISINDIFNVPIVELVLVNKIMFATAASFCHFMATTIGNLTFKR